MASPYEKYIWDFLLEKSGNEYGTAGLMGNLYAESGLYPNNLQNDYESSLGYTDEEYTEAVSTGVYSEFNFVNDAAGYGLAQWTYSTRKQNLYNNFINGGYDSIANIDLQLNFLYAEMLTSFAGVWRTICNAQSIREASDKALHDFENPANQSERVEENRAEFSQRYYDQYANGGGTPVKKKRKGLPLWMMYHSTRRRFNVV